MRYPDDYYIPAYDEAETAIAAAKRIRDFVLEHIEIGTDNNQELK
ncbi:MAG TPA: hypothetical protein PKL57_17825 [Candidatus Wallbacteria bacterium]|nr:hypothetical protein [Candidatus Wallbacteria bacterium]